jgi:monoamine oxidase
VSSQPDVIIIGAGSAGLSAAKELTRQGLSYTLVEGSHRIGGRAYSEEIAPDVGFDLGCSYLHSAEHNPFVAIADDLGVVLGKEYGNIFDEDQQRLCYNRVQLNDVEAAACWEYFEQCHKAIGDASKRGEDIAVSDTLDLDSPYAKPFMAHLAELCGGDIDELSTVDLERWVGGSDYPVLNGFGNLIAKWGGDVSVSLNAKVESIDWSAAGVRVETSKGTLTGRVVGSSFEASLMGQNVAVINTGGRFGIWLEKQGQQAGHDFALEQIANVFGNDIRKSASRSIITAWYTDPWTLGSYSHALPGQAHQREVLARSIDDQVFFAGEATHIDFACAMHGAYLSGIRAAQEIKAVLK